MSYLWKILRTLMAVSGAILIYLAASTSDYYMIELEQAEPNYIGTMVLWGVMLIVPAFIHGCRQVMKGEE